MPRGDGTGPMGFGPMTGRGAGYCAGYPVPGFMNPLPYGRGGYPRPAYGYGMMPPAYGYGAAPGYFGAQPRWGYGRGFRGRGWAAGRAPYGYGWW